ncbi:hypothetical protein LOTGIDRAFT_168635 [Lottia gigantea]|uniref:C-type lectin domain-containing protein n=1 Tax=Lottia gigantea TaxID=225164 RepID=V3ZUG0_LOTGI|nr:hypothetical protein LOTGIDRAFT_168635 [Lottia gigantea]ESO84566.1 hypothetical protein LOTGIDRAFT_168635 [Lottia gigantea]
MEEKKSLICTICENGGCPTYDDYIYHRQSGTCYKPYILAKVVPYESNVNFCTSKGEQLFHHYDDVRLNQLSLQLNASSAYSTHPGGFYIAGSDDRVEGLWEYADGSLVLHFMWYGNQPQNKTSENFMAIKFDDEQTFKFGMSDAKRHWTKAPICQKF